tara:strand:+ start:801 stop:1019 length:219 start_codon:yes stop_codon:yes gene_type:complete
MTDIEARRAKELLEDEVLKSALTKVQEDLKKRWATSSPNEAKLREELYHELLGSLSFERKLKAMLGNGLKRK